MDSEQLRALQSPLKDRYRAAPEAARITLKADGRIGENVTCSVETGRALVAAGLHPATGGDGLHVCSGDMLLQALVACAGVTLNAVATALRIPLTEGRVTAEGDLDFRGTLGVDKEAPVGFTAIRLTFELASTATAEQLAVLQRLTERYCVVYQTLRNGPAIQVHMTNMLNPTAPLFLKRSIPRARARSPSILHPSIGRRQRRRSVQPGTFVRNAT